MKMNIKITKPIKYTECEYSIFVSCAYSRDVVNNMMTMFPRVWHKELKCWELPLYKLWNIEHRFSWCSLNIQDER